MFSILDHANYDKKYIYILRNSKFFFVTGILPGAILYKEDDFSELKQNWFWNLLLSVGLQVGVCHVQFYIWRMIS